MGDLRTMNRCAAALLRTTLAAAALAAIACSAEPQPRAAPPATLTAVNLSLAQRFADVSLVDGMILHRLRSVRVSPDRLSWVNDQRQLREMPIAQVTRIVARGKDPDAPAPTEGARLLRDPAPPSSDPLAASATNGTTIMGPVLPGSSAGEAVLAAVVTTLGVVSLESEEPGEIVYEGPVTRYLPARPALEPLVQ